MIVIQIVKYGNCDKFLIMHPFYGSSHVLTLHHVAEALIEKGHEVSRVSWKYEKLMSKESTAGKYVMFL